MGETEHNTFRKGVIRGLPAPSPAGGRAWPGRPKRRLKRPRGLLSCLSSRCAGGRRGPRVLQTQGSRETHVSQRTLKRPGVRARVCREGERGAWESTLQDNSSRRQAWGPGFRCPCLQACRNALSACPFRGLRGDLRERAALSPRQSGFCSGAATIGDTKCRDARCEGTVLEKAMRASCRLGRWPCFLTAIYLRTQAIFVYLFIFFKLRVCMSLGGEVMSRNPPYFNLANAKKLFGLIEIHT